MSVIFQSFDLQELYLRNRIIMAPMTRSRVGLGDTPTAMNAEYYAQRASSGLIITEAIVVTESARGYLFTPGLYTEDQVAGWRLVTEAVHSKGGRIFAQLWHVGRVSHVSVQPNGDAPVGPTDEYDPDIHTFAITESGKPGPVTVSPPRALRTEEIRPLVDEFVRAAKWALRSGFDGLEILAANGYLFDQFLNSRVGKLTSALFNSLVVAILSSAVACGLGFLAAYGLARYKLPGSGLQRVLITSPLMVSYLIIGLGLLMTFNMLGVSRSLFTVAIGHVVINMPLCFSIIYAQMGDHQINIERAARDLGAKDWQVMTLVTAPMLMPAIIASYFLSITFSWDEFIIAFLLSRFDVTLPVEIWSLLRSGLNPKTNAVGSVVFIVSIVLVFMLEFFVFRKDTKK